VVVQRDQLVRLLDLQDTPFDQEATFHRDMLAHLWRQVFGVETEVPPITPEEAKAHKQKASHDHVPGTLSTDDEDDWGRLGFQRGDCPGSDFRGTGLLALHCMSDLARHESGLVLALCETQRARRAGYPLAAACINVTMLLLQLLRSSDDPSCPIIEGLEMSPLFRFLCRRSESPATFEGVFRACVLIMEQLWVMHRATYMEFPRIMAALRTILRHFLDARPRGLQSLVEWNLSAVELPNHPIMND